MSYIQRVVELAWVFLRLGCTSFGGPVAHLGYFHHEFVVRRAWFSEQGYADMVALCQFLPGPTSSQVGIMVGLHRGGVLGALIAWLAFTLPSVLALVVFAIGMLHSQDIAQSAWVHGLKLAAVAIVIHAVWTMAQNFCKRSEQVFLLLVALAGSLASAQLPGGVFTLLFFSAVYGGWRFKDQLARLDALDFQISPFVGALCLLSLGLVWWALLYWHQSSASVLSGLVTALYQAGAMVFGGGHLVLALLQDQLAVFLPQLSESVFLAGYGATQAVPGPLFTVGAYLGAVSLAQTPWWGGLLGMVAIFLPAWLIVLGVVPFWQRLRRWPSIQGALAGVNAAVVGVLAAVLYDPLWSKTVVTSFDFYVVVVAVVALMRWRLSPLWVVLGCAGIAALGA